MEKIKYFILGIVAIFIITNPSVSAFKTFRGKSSYDGLYRPINLFVFSIYKDRSHPFVGLFGNFIDVHKKEIEVAKVPVGDSTVYNQLIQDSSYHVTDTIGKPKTLIFYANLIKEGYNIKNLGNYDQFKNAIRDTSKAVKIYFNLKKDGYNVNNLGTLDEFKKTFCKI